MTIPLWLIKCIKFGAVGALGMLLDFFITWLCKEKLKLNKYLSNGIGFVLAVTQNYIINRSWTFRSEDPDIIYQFTLFVLISLIGLGLNTGIIYLLHGRAAIPFYFSKLLAIVMVFVWNFTANYFFTF